MRLPAATRTPEFVRWFGSSRVVDERGRPRVLFHGTSAAPRFYSFLTQPEDFETEGRLGAYFTPSRRQAQKFADPTGMGYRDTRIIPVLLSLQRPFDVTGLANDVRLIADRVGEVIGLTAVEVSLLKSRFTTSPFMLLEGANKTYDLVARLRALGYDGVIFDDSVEGVTYVAFQPQQIKHATANRGAYNPADADIRR